MRSIETLVADEEEVEPLPPGPSGKALAVKGKKMSVKDAEEAAIRAGLTAVSFKAITGHKALGEFITQSGAVPIGRSLLILAHQHLANGLSYCDKLLTDKPSVIEAVPLLQALGTLAKAQIDAANGLIKSAGLADGVNPTANPVVPGFGPGRVVVPIQVNQVNMAHKKEDDNVAMPN